MLLPASAGGRELLLRDVDPETRAPRRASHAEMYAGPAAELDDVLAGDVPEQACSSLRDVQDPPGNLLRGPVRSAPAT